MNKNILVAADIYPKQIKEYPTNIENIEEFSLEVLKKTQSWAYMFHLNLKKLNYNVSSILLNINELSSEHKNIDPKKYFFKKILEFKPDLFIIENARFFNSKDLKHIKSISPNCLLVTHYCSCLKKRHLVCLNNYDQVLCCSPYFFNSLAIKESQKKLFYHSSPDNGFKYHNPCLDDKIIKCSFFGSIFAKTHLKRKKLLSYLVSRDTPLDIYSTINGSSLISSFSSFLRRKKLVDNFLGNPISKLENYLEESLFRLRDPLLSNIKMPCFDNKMLSTLSNYICTVNVHTSFANGYAANMRLFEAASVGTCLITEDFPNLSELFEPDYEILTYSSKEECYEKIQYCINNPDAAIEIASRAHLRALNEHRYSNRIAEFLNNLFK
tara:strand:- start:888 stop:2033 length:1146 start_codon:yes stop_codon:yes gene_type:complete